MINTRIGVSILQYCDLITCPNAAICLVRATYTGYVFSVRKKNHESMNFYVSANTIEILAGSYAYLKSCMIVLLLQKISTSSKVDFSCATNACA